MTAAPSLTQQLLTLRRLGSADIIMRAIKVRRAEAELMAAHVLCAIESLEKHAKHLNGPRQRVE